MGERFTVPFRIRVLQSKEKYTILRETAWTSWYKISAKGIFNIELI